MLNKEEIEYIEQIEKAIENNENFYWQEDMYELIEIIKKQHGREQKLIEKLEKEKLTIESTYSQINGNYFMAQDRLDLIKEILEIVKGVENV